MATVLSQLETVQQNILTQLAEITANPKVSYSVDGQSVSWSEYNRLLWDMLNSVNQQIQVAGGPLFITTTGWSN